MPINFLLLTSAVQQSGPWKQKNISVTKNWFIKELKEKINRINWEEAKQDVARFLRPRELISLDVWSKEFFLSRTAKLAGYLIT